MKKTIRWVLYWSPIATFIGALGIAGCRPARRLMVDQSVELMNWTAAKLGCPELKTSAEEIEYIGVMVGRPEGRR